MKSQRYLLAETEPVVAVVVPVHNQAEIIVANLDALLQSLTLPFEIVIVNDGSQDGTGRELNHWREKISQNPPTNVCSIEILETRYGKFETWCDQQAIERTHAPYIIEIQADMNIRDYGFDARLLKFLRSSADVIALSGRGVETFIDASTNFKNDIENTPFRGLDFGFSFFTREAAIASRVIIGKILGTILNSKKPKDEDVLPKIGTHMQVKESEEFVHYSEVFPDKILFRSSKRAGRLGMLMEKCNEIPAHAMNQIWMGESIMRGPLIIDRSKFIEIDGFNSDIFFLGHDDHDMARRAWITRGYRVGFHPVNFTSPLNHGSTRKYKSFAKKYVLSKKRARMARKSSESYLISHMDIDRYQLPKSEVRTLD